MSRKRSIFLLIVVVVIAIGAAFARIAEISRRMDCFGGAMNALLCNQKLVSSSMGGDLILQQTLIQIASKRGDAPGKAVGVGR